MWRACVSISAADGYIPPTAIHGPASPKRPASRLIGGPPAWGRQYRDLGFSQTEQAAATQAFTDWRRRMMKTPPASDCAADALEPDGEWNAYLQAMSGFLTGAGLERISVADYLAYDAASTGCNWRAPAGYGSLVAASLPRPIDLRLSTPVESIELDSRAVVLGDAGWRRSRTRRDPHGLDGCAGRRHDRASACA